MISPDFTREQEDWICYQIGEWYIQYKNKMTEHVGNCKGCDCGTHILGAAKEMLKIRLCGQEKHLFADILKSIIEENNHEKL